MMNDKNIDEDAIIWRNLGITGLVILLVTVGLIVISNYLV